MKNQNIEGIHVYCDRWCERCTLTSRCAIYEDETNLSREELDRNNEVFWERIGLNLVKAESFLKKVAAGKGIDLEAELKDPEFEERYQRKLDLGAESRKHPLALLSLEYSKLGRDWLKTQPGMLDHLEALKEELLLGVESQEDAKKETAVIRDSLAVIQWYLVFIHVKLSRALMGRQNDYSWDEKGEFPRDYDGSAKIAIIAIDRSINAWSALFEILPDEEDHFYRVLGMLQKIRSMAVEEFPGAMSFVRPGFDG
ncbi:MAG: hypothetical protein M3Y60_07765 [Bacteroidota bacterium]|nr:hypothetical protein [Bacteroidota bacterium]